MATTSLLPDRRTQWVNTVEFPFLSRIFESPDGRMHYVDEGYGHPIIFLHGLPTWSFLYRKLITQMAGQFRCIAIDHLGMGLSDKPKDADYSPAAHALRLQQLVESLDLQNVTIVGHDFGGSIGLDWASQNPDRVRDIILMNTWVWCLSKNPVIRSVSKAASSPINQYWFRLLNPSPKFYFPILFADKHRLPKWVQDQYQHAFNNQFETYCPEALARAMTGDPGWFQATVERLPRLHNKPCLILWGTDDITYGEDAHSRLLALFPNAASIPLVGVGNYPSEESPDECVRHMTRFLS